MEKWTNKKILITDNINQRKKHSNLSLSANTDNIFLK